LRRFIKLAAINAAVFSAVACCVVFTLGAVAAENALRPARVPVAKVCPCLAHERCKSVEITAQDATTLRAWYYEPEISNGKAVLLLHGVAGNRQDMVALGNFFLKQGYSALEPDLRGHGESGGFATYGVLETSDVHAWLDWLEKAGNSPRIYGFGVSLGAAILLESLGRESRFRAVVAESSYSDFPSIARERMGRAFPTGMKWIAGPFAESGIGWVRYHYGIDLRQADPRGALQSTRVPVLLIHGLSDDKTSPDNSRRLAAMNPSAQLWMVPGSGHANAWKTARAEFESRVGGWFSTH
jgi:pimeloyl-ACP methyl ester carboxylesterase